MSRSPLGFVTMLTWSVVLILYRLATPVPSFETQSGDVAENETPQGLTRFGSVIWAGLSA